MGIMKQDCGCGTRQKMLKRAATQAKRGEVKTAVKTVAKTAVHFAKRPPAVGGFKMGSIK